MPGIRRSKHSQGRPGRPPKDLAGDVEQRILNAAEKLFLDKGFKSTSIDEIAALAPASKPTVYAHFSGKEALFAAVVSRIVERLSNVDDYLPGGRSVSDKLISLGMAIVERGILNLVGVTRAAIAEAQRFPDLSRHLHEVGRNQAADAVSQLLDQATQILPPHSRAAFGANRRAATAQIFMDLILLPMLMRALMGDDAKTIRKELPTFVRQRVAFFLTACERDWKEFKF